MKLPEAYIKAARICKLINATAEVHSIVDKISFTSCLSSLSNFFIVEFSIIIKLYKL